MSAHTAPDGAVSPDEPVVVGVDIGGTKVLAARVGCDGSLGPVARRSTRSEHGSVAELEDALTSAVAEAAGGLRPAAVGISAAGLVDDRADLVHYCTHLPWRDDAVRPRLEERWQVPVVLENDANCAAVAEVRLGAARSLAADESFLMITIGTGIGGAIVHQGRLWHGRQGMAGEFGHMRLVPEGLPCPCGLAGCWEQYCSGTALRRLVAAHRPELRDGAAVTQAARDGDAAAVAAFTQVGTWLGAGVAGLTSAFDPSLVVIGGGVSAAGELLLGPARSALARNTYAARYRRLPDLVPAELGPEAGAVGAALLARGR